MVLRFYRVTSPWSKAPTGFSSSARASPLPVLVNKHLSPVLCTEQSLQSYAWLAEWGRTLLTGHRSWRAGTDSVLVAQGHRWLLGPPSLCLPDLGHTILPRQKKHDYLVTFWYVVCPRRPGATSRYHCYMNLGLSFQHIFLWGGGTFRPRPSPSVTAWNEEALLQSHGREENKRFHRSTQVVSTRDSNEAEHPGCCCQLC